MTSYTGTPTGDRFPPGSPEQLELGSTTTEQQATPADTDRADIVELALAYHRRGWAVLHLDPGSKNPDRPDWQFERHTEETIRAAFGRQHRNVSVLLGRVSGGLADLDLDHPLVAAYASGVLPPTEAVFGRPGKRGGHRFYRCDPLPKSELFKDPVPREQGGMGTLAEIRSGSSQHTVLPGSTHAGTGERIEWEQDGEPSAVEAELLRGELARACAAALLAFHWPDESRHFAALALAGGLLNAGWDEDAVLGFIEDVCWLAVDEEAKDRLKAVEDTVTNRDERNTTGWPTLAELIDERVVEQVRKWLGITFASDRHPLTDFGNAERFVQQHGMTVRYNATDRRWLVWDGQRWQVDERGVVYEKAQATIRSIFLEAAAVADTEQSERTAKWAIACQQGRRLDTMLERARTDSSLVVTAADLDIDPWLLNVANGTLDLRRGELRSHNSDDLITKLLPVAWDPNAACPRWLNFITSAMSVPTARGLIRQLEMEAYLQRLVGYCLTGDVSEKMLPILWGDTNTGKTTFTEILQALFGPDYGGVLTETSIAMKQHNNGMNHDLAEYKGTRLLVVSETAENLKLNESRIKALTGGNPVRARKLYAEFFIYRPEYTILIETNNRPTITGKDEAVWFRVKLIPFLNRLRDDQIDRGLKTKLKAELPGILAWAVAGAVEWQRGGGLKEPAQVTAATEDYRTDSDALQEFLAERCVLEPSGRIRSSILYDEYLRWTPRGAEVLTSRQFGDDLRKRGLEKKTVKGYATWFGIQLSRDSDEGALFDGPGG